MFVLHFLHLKLPLVVRNGKWPALHKYSNILMDLSFDVIYLFLPLKKLKHKILKQYNFIVFLVSLCMMYGAAKLSSETLY